jgi:hypothetical protein
MNANQSKPQDPRAIIGRRFHIEIRDTGPGVRDNVDDWRDRHRIALRLRAGAGRYAAIMQEFKPRNK